MRGGARPGAGRKKGEGYKTFSISLPISKAVDLQQRAELEEKTVSKYIADKLKLGGNMTEVFKEAINIFMAKTNPWELTATEQQQLLLAMRGDAGAFCDLLASQGMQRMPEFDAFFAELNADGE